MTDQEGQEKKVHKVPEAKSDVEKFLEEKRNAALGNTSSNQFGSRNPMAGRSGFGGKAGGGGKTTIRKHSARSR